MKTDRVTDGRADGPFTSDDRDHMTESPIQDAAQVRQKAGLAAAKGRKTVQLDVALASRLAEAYISLAVEYQRLQAESADALWQIARAAGSPPPTPASTPEQVAQAFHETYERLAPSFGYETRKASAVPWPEVPENNRQLMTAVAGEVLALIAQPDREPLWTATTADSNEREHAPPGKSYLAECLLDVPPGTAVRVDEDTPS